MIINTLMEQKHISKYRLAKDNNIPYMTLNDLCNGKTSLEKCSAETVYKIAKGLNVSMEKILEPYVIERIDFDLFKSNVCHRLKSLGDIEFLKETIMSEEILVYYRREWWRECLYLLAMVDYISRLNGISLVEDYNNIRKMKLEKVVYPKSLIIKSSICKDPTILDKAIKESIPEFIKFNIVEADVRNVI